MTLHRRKNPLVADSKMLDRRVGGYSTFGIDQENTDFVRSAVLHCRLESVECLLAPAASHDAGPTIRRSQFFAISGETFLAPFNRVLVVVSTTFDVDSDSHQRFPPISPLAHR